MASKPFGTRHPLPRDLSVLKRSELFEKLGIFVERIGHNRPAETKQPDYLGGTLGVEFEESGEHTNDPIVIALLTRHKRKFSEGGRLRSDLPTGPEGRSRISEQGRSLLPKRVARPLSNPGHQHCFGTTPLGRRQRVSPPIQNVEADLGAAALACVANH